MTLHKDIMLDFEMMRHSISIRELSFLKEACSFNEETCNLKSTAQNLGSIAEKKWESNNEM